VTDGETTTTYPYSYPYGANDCGSFSLDRFSDGNADSLSLNSRSSGSSRSSTSTSALPNKVRQPDSSMEGSGNDAPAKELILAISAEFGLL
jgi:hypothetical protein